MKNLLCDARGATEQSCPGLLGRSRSSGGHTQEARGLCRAGEEGVSGLHAAGLAGTASYGTLPCHCDPQIAKGQTFKLLMERDSEGLLRVHSA